MPWPKKRALPAFCVVKWVDAYPSYSNDQRLFLVAQISRKRCCCCRQIDGLDFVRTQDEMSAGYETG